MLADLSYRKVVIKMFWDDQNEPSVLAPLGDFFCIGEQSPLPGGRSKRDLMFRQLDAG
jgi:hypothetical protein